jgi:hypothetical protein
MGFDIERDYDSRGGYMTEDIKKGSVGISENSHALLVSLVNNVENQSNDQPFESIVEAFRFAFSLGFAKQRKKEKSGSHVTVAPRQFVVTEYLELLRFELSTSKKSLGGLISEYAEGGCEIISEAKSALKPVLHLLD